MGQSTLEFTDSNFTLRDMVYKFYQKRGQNAPVNSAYYVEHEGNEGVPLNLQSKVITYEPPIFKLHMEFTDYTEFPEFGNSTLGFNQHNKNYVFSLIIHLISLEMLPWHCICIKS